MKNKVKLKHVIIIDALLVLVIAAAILISGSPGKVSRFNVVRSTYDSAVLTWSAASEATGYRIYRSNDGSHFYKIAFTNHTSYVDGNLVTGTEYSYYVKPYKGLVRSFTDKSNTGSVIPSLEQPEFKVSTKKGYIDVSVTPVPGADGYAFYRDGALVAEQTDPSFVDAEAEVNTSHKYTVKAFRYTDNPVYSELSKTVKATLKSVSKLTPEILGSDILFKWDSDETYTNFKLYSNGELVSETTDLEYLLRDFDPEKTYEMKLVGTSADGKKTSPDMVQTFEIKAHDMTNQEAIDAACDWGVMIAEDNTFTYGVGKRAHRYGCYFCQTNVGPVLNKKGSSLVDGHSYEKTYCCNPFVHACYAHGAGDPAMLNACQHGGGISMSQKSFTRYGNWKSVGKPSRGNLQRGDVLVSGGHVALYIGDGKVVQAIDKGWTDRSIDVFNLPDKSYKKYKFVMRYTGNGSGTGYTIEEKSA